MLKCDVLIVGGGIAGLSAAAEVPPELSVILADAGGAASTEIMGFSAPANEPDSPERMFEDTIRSGGGESDPALVRVLCSRALRELKRLERLGIVFDRTAAGSYDMVPALGTSFPRVVHSGTTTGKQVMERLARPVLRERVTELFTADGGAVAGARLESGEIISTRAVVLAGGGFAGLWKRSTWSKKLRGDALTLGMSVGARLRGVGFIQFEPTVTADGFPVITTALREGAELLTERGDRLSPAPRKRELARQIQQEIDRGGEVFYDFSGVDERRFAERYPEYFRRFQPWPPRFSVRPTPHTTLGGLEIDPDGATCVPGLFAAGECTGGIHGRDRLGGNAGLETLVFGRIAGSSAARYAASAPRLAFRESPPREQPGPEVFAEIAAIFDRCVTVCDEPEKLREAQRLLALLPPFPVVKLAEKVCERKEYADY